MNKIRSTARLGFTWEVELIDPRGHVLSRDRVHNLIPDEGLNYLMNAGFKGAAQVNAWFVSVFEGNYTPTAGLTAAGYAALATECTTYDEAARPQFVPGAVVAGSIDNGNNRAEFTFNAAKTIYGGVLVSASAKGAATGVIVSAVRFPSPKMLDVGSVLRVVAGNSLVSV